MDSVPTKCKNTEFRWGERTFVMGIVNITPDSFSGDGLGNNADAAVARARRLVDEGADIIDVGGESTRPGSTPVGETEELERVIPVIKRLASQISVPVSVDTYKSGVARKAIEAGAGIINDIWGLKNDPGIARVAAEFDVPLILMHNQNSRSYGNLMKEVLASLQNSLDQAQRCGVKWEKLIIDPGIGFGKTLEHNLEIIQKLEQFRTLGRPVLLGTSRKSLIGLTLNLPPDQRIEGTAATVAIGIAGGADIIRVHDVKEMVRVARMSDAIIRRKFG